MLGEKKEERSIASRCPQRIHEDEWSSFLRESALTVSGKAINNLISAVIFLYGLHQRSLKQKSMQSVAYKDQKNSTFPSDEPLSNAIIISYIITNSVKVIMTSPSVFICCKQLQKMITVFCML